MNTRMIIKLLSDEIRLLFDRDLPRRYFFCRPFMFLFCLVCAVSLCASVYLLLCGRLLGGGGGADLLALVCGVYCEFVTFPLVSWVRCGT